MTCTIPWRSGCGSDYGPCSSVRPGPSTPSRNWSNPSALLGMTERAPLRFSPTEGRAEFGKRSNSPRSVRQEPASLSRRGETSWVSGVSVCKERERSVVDALFRSHNCISRRCSNERAPGYAVRLAQLARRTASPKWFNGNGYRFRAAHSRT